VLAESEGADAETVDEMLEVLRSPQGCADATALDELEPAWQSAQSRRVAHGLVPALERVRALRTAGRQDEALALVNTQRQRIEAEDDPAVRAAVLLMHGKVLSARQDDEDARVVLEDAVWAAEAGGDVESAAAGWTELVSVLPRMGRYEAAEAAAVRASAAVHRLGDPELQLVLLGNRAVLASMQGRYDEALQQHQQVLEQGIETWGPDDEGVTRTHVNLAAVLGNLGRLEEASEHMAIALERQRAAYPDGHPDMVRMLSNLGAVQFKQGHLDDARATFERALAQAEQSFDPSHPTVAKVLGNLGQVDYSQGKIDQARRRYERMLPILREHHGDEHPDIATALHNLAGTQASGGELALAIATYREALAMRERVLGPQNPGTAISLQAMGSTLLRAGELTEAIELLERAQAIRTEASVDPYQRATTAFTLGKARAAAGQPELGRPLVEQARELLVPIQPRHAELLAEVEQWLASPPASDASARP
ncbi:MAG: tetratricopeptide repeat protein, partial [Nannocystaceae bacterium]